MYFIYDEEYLDEDDDFDYLMSPCFETFEKAANYGTLKALRENKSMVTLITKVGMIITFWNPLLDDPKSQISNKGIISFKKYTPDWIKTHYKKGEKGGKKPKPDIPDICPEFDVD
jgi:hypothetical protein